MTAGRPGSVPFDWRRFLDLAERLARETDDEAALRSAVSRAYYAVFNLARQRLRDHGCWSPGLDPHTRVWAGYRDASNPVCRRIGEKGFNLRDRRRRADYEDAPPANPTRQAVLAVALAHQIVAALDGLDPAETCCPPVGTPTTT